MHSPTPSIPPPEQESAELSLFREAWKAEVQKKKTLPATSDSPDVGPPPHAQQPSQPEPEPESQPGPSSHTIAGYPVPSTRIYITSPRSPESALEIYQRAIKQEQHGELDNALLLYRQAFRMDPHVDRAYAREERIAVLLAPGATAVPQKTSLVLPAKDTSVDELARSFRLGLAVKTSSTGKSGGVVTGTLASLLGNFPKDVTFEAEDDKQGAPLKTLPDELLVLILRKLDPRSIEHFAAVNRKARIVSLESAIWRELVVATYKPPQILDIESMDMVVDHYLSDYRRIYVEHPRLRIDGVYIAVCHYVRAGISENNWVNISHLITYHRYLRFFPSGQVLSLLTNEEYDPKQIIPLLKPTLRMKGLFTGTWHLQGTTVHLLNLIDASGQLPLPPHTTSPSHSNFNTSQNTNTTTRYVFTMTLTLRSRPMGRWNKLDILSYDSVNLETGDATPVALRHERPFWFSRVRSYAGQV